MKFFNLDLHIAVIADLKQIFQALGHDVTDWSISAHTWVFGRDRDHVDVVNEKTWKLIDQAMCDAFYERYKTELGQYDAFIVTHTPCFAMLYERWDKPIICVASTRYEHPFSDNREAWEHFNQFLRTKIDSGIIIPVANNKYDADYAEYFTQRTWQLIPSLCDYTNATYTGKLKDSLYPSKFDAMPEIPGLISKTKAFQPSILSRLGRKMNLTNSPRGPSWQDLADFRSIVHIPYNASIMSIFEMYAAGVPMLFPSPPFAARLYSEYRTRGVFSELSFNQVRGLPSRSILPCDTLDPNNFENEEIMMHWIAKADFYDPENMAGLIYFESFGELADQLGDMDTRVLHERVVAHQRIRVRRVHAAWESLIAGIKIKYGG